MGLFGGLFNKKVCCACGGEIGMLGNRKLEDGNLCKKCASKLSPWFSERRHSTVDQILEQLRYREENRKLIPSFHETRAYGYFTKIHIDDNMQAFMVTSSHDWMNDNPDIIGYDSLIDCAADIHEDRHEVYRRLPDGHTESFNPRRYDYDYDFNILLRVNSPWFDDIRFSLKTNVHEDDRRTLDECIAISEDIVETMTGTRPDLSAYVPYHPPFCRRCGRELPRGMVCHCDQIPDRAPIAAPAPAPRKDPEPRPVPMSEHVRPASPVNARPEPAQQRPGVRTERPGPAGTAPGRQTPERAGDQLSHRSGNDGYGQRRVEPQRDSMQRGQNHGNDPRAPKGPGPRRG